jgi:hypothetical protein
MDTKSKDFQDKIDEDKLLASLNVPMMTNSWMFVEKDER